MLRNLINYGDAVRAYEKARAGSRRFTGLRADDRVRAAWAATERPPIYWHTVPAVRAHWQKQITGGLDQTIERYVVNEYLQGLRPCKALSVGCGAGRKEARWAQTGAFSIIDAYDLSPSSIASASGHAAELGISDRLNFSVADVRTLEIPASAYDVIFADNALHHFSPLAPVIARLRNALRPGGVLVLRDFVGPARFQWTDRQVAVAEGLLAFLPEAYRVRWGTGKVKRHVYRPGRLAMRMADPSEAAESDQILPLLKEQMRLVVRNDLGGTVLHLLLHDIAHHFQDPSKDEAHQLLQLCINAEEVLVASGNLPSDFVFALYEAL